MKLTSEVREALRRHNFSFVNADSVEPLPAQKPMGQIAREKREEALERARVKAMRFAQ